MFAIVCPCILKLNLLKLDNCNPGQCLLFLSEVCKIRHFTEDNEQHLKFCSYRNKFIMQIKKNVIVISVKLWNFEKKKETGSFFYKCHKS